MPRPYNAGSLSASPTRAVVIVIPAEGPSLGVAPSGK